MATLQGNTIASTFKDLLQVSNSNSGVDATARTVEDGEGTASALKISTTEVQVSGNFTVTGTSTTIDTTNLNVDDGMIQLGKDNNSADVIDIGFVGLYDTSGSQDLYAGLFRDASDSGKWKLFKDSQEDLSTATTVSTGATGYAEATLVASLEASTVDINGGTIDGVTIGGASAGAGTFTTFTSNGIDDNATSTAITIDSSQDVTLASHLVLPYGQINDAGTDMNIVSTNALTLQTSAGTAITIPNASTNVGIGTTSPVSQLSNVSSNPTGGTASSDGMVWGATTAGYAAIIDNSHASGSGLRLQYGSTSELGLAIYNDAVSKWELTTKNGNVGIGHTNPQNELVVATTTTEGPSLELQFNADPTGVAAQKLGELIFTGNDPNINIGGGGQGDNSSIGAKIVATATAAWGDAGNDDDDSPTKLEFYTQSDGTADGMTSPNMTIDSSGNVGIGVTDPDMDVEIKKSSANVTLKINAATAANDAQLQFCTGDSADWLIGVDGSATNDPLTFYDYASSSVVMALNNGSVGIGTSSPESTLDVQGSSAEIRSTWTGASSAGVGGAISVIQDDGAAIGSGHRIGYIAFKASEDASNTLHTSAIINAFASELWSASQNGSYLTFETTANGATSRSERLRIDSSGDVMISKSTTSQATAGIATSAGLGVRSTVDGNICILVNRLTDDGSLISLRQSSAEEGTISVSGSTVSYNGFSGNHESSGIPDNTAIGTVVSTIDELDVYPDIDSQTGEAHSKSGQDRKDHAKIKVSDSIGDARVYGVLSIFNDDNKPIVASVGIGSIRVTGACEGGDLLESNGDGTAKVQDDDIIRSKTIGKVTVGNSDASEKLVACVLYCG